MWKQLSGNKIDYFKTYLKSEVQVWINLFFFFKGKNWKIRYSDHVSVSFSLKKLLLSMSVNIWILRGFLINLDGKYYPMEKIIKTCYWRKTIIGDPLITFCAHLL